MPTLWKRRMRLREVLAQPSSTAHRGPLRFGPLFVCWLRGCIWFVKMHYFPVYTYFTKKFLIIKKWDLSCFPSFL